MEAMILIVPVFILIAIVTRMMAGGMDHDRIRQYVEQRGGRVIDSNWSPMGPGWFGEQTDRIYGVRYVDRDGHEHEAHCKTSMWSGVYLTEDRIIRRREAAALTPMPTPTTADALAEENRRLREEVGRLRRERGEA